MVVEFETFPDLFGFAAFPFCLHAIMIFLLCMMYAISLLFPVILPMFAVMKRTCRYCVLARYVIRSRLCCGSPSHTGTFGRERGRSLEGDFLVLARFFIRSSLCCGSHWHTGTFGRGRGRSLEGDFLVLARFFIRSCLCCSSPSHAGTFGRGRGRSLEGEFLALYVLLALSIIYTCLPGFFLRPAGTRRQPSSFIRAWDRLGNVLNSIPPHSSNCYPFLTPSLRFPSPRVPTSFIPGIPFLIPHAHKSSAPVNDRGHISD